MNIEWNLDDAVGCRAIKRPRSTKFEDGGVAVERFIPLSSYGEMEGVSTSEGHAYGDKKVRGRLKAWCFPFMSDQSDSKNSTVM